VPIIEIIDITNIETNICLFAIICFDDFAFELFSLLAS